MSEERTPHTKRPLSPREAEELLLATAGDIMEKSASTAVELGLDVTAPPPEADRFEDRIVAEVEEEARTADAADPEWGDTPTVKDQMLRFPESVRSTHPVTAVLDLSAPADLAEFNRIQQEAAAPYPKIDIAVMDRQFFEGKWSVLLTYAKIQYQKL